MKNINIKARIKRNKLEELADTCFRTEGDEIIEKFNRRNIKVFVGIQRYDGIYTILGAKSAYYLTDGIEKEIPFKDLLSFLTINALKNGKHYNYEFLEISDNNNIWVKDIQTMNALWNTILLLYENG
ncbi:hypothetical protein OC25_07910 [Pedobacter kyungheensis]|uniref:Uncharacterized protein n=1 Tax=Pedobacter kyungheensis TaxID=1069985 RepID=A0A0C1FTV2_9SPHI|nr:hypothetical protein [Pedobacter kyungheensis]KIA95228.1 hypothetical protein OC25_07910 [Pedobacter kyungheensis]